MPISEATRRKIFRTLREEDIGWSGNLNDGDFLSRIYDLDQLPSHDYRFDNAKEDIWQHTVNNPGDWDSYWIFDDDRFDLLHCSDYVFLRFLCEMINPKVRSKEEAKGLLDLFNENIRPEGYQIVEKPTRFGNIRYEPVGIIANTISALDQVKDIAETLKSEHLLREIVRMTTAIDRDPELAIGTAKEFVETICKTILKERKKPFKDDEDLARLVYLTLQEVEPLKTVEFDEKTNKMIKKTLGALSTLTQSIAELRNLHGTGHGKDAGKNILEQRYAVLAVNAATTLAFFLYQSHEKALEK